MRGQMLGERIGDLVVFFEGLSRVLATTNAPECEVIFDVGSENLGGLEL